MRGNFPNAQAVSIAFAQHFKPTMKSILTLCLALAIAGCATNPTTASAHAGQSSEEVRAKLGAPAAERKLPSGQSAWYYVTAPSGWVTWRAVFGRDGRVAEYAQVLTRENLQAVPPAASRDAVLDRLGPPMERMTFERTATETWTYRWLDGTLEMLADVTFGSGDKGVVQIALRRDPAFTGTSR